MSRSTMDAVIAITGAVALLFTVFGVFAYEHNATPATDDEDAVVFEQIPEQTASGSLGQGETAAPLFHPGTGVTGMSVLIEWTPTAPALLGPVATLNYQLSDAEGVVLDSGSTTSSATFVVPQPLPLDYTLTLTVPGSGGGGSFDVTVTYDY